MLYHIVHILPMVIMGVIISINAISTFIAIVTIIFSFNLHEHNHSSLIKSAWLQRKPLVSDPDMYHGTCRDTCRDR